MTKRRAVLIGGVAGLVMPAAVMTLLYFFGVWQIMVGHTDVRRVLWPFSVMLTVGWCCTLPGILTTIAAIAYNCLLYIGIALLLRAGISRLVHLKRS